MNGRRRRLAEAGWGIAASVLFERAITVLSSAWSTSWLKYRLRMFGCAYGAGLTADGNVVIRLRRKGSITLGDGVTLKSRFGSNLVGLTGPTVLECGREGRIVFGDHSGCSGAVISSRSEIVIGDHVNIGGNVRIFDHDFHSLDHLARRDAQRDLADAAAAPVRIGNDVFIGAQAVILKGVTIGDRAIIGAGAVVSMRQIPAGAVVAGNPARIVKVRTPSRAQDPA
jgi:acetyltransferase-like isoleucine patch superfamily enzyme